MGGVPRRRVATEEGRAAVEAWLRGLELRGQPTEGPGGRMLDLDGLRRELGLPVVVGGRGAELVTEAGGIEVSAARRVPVRESVS